MLVKDSESFSSKFRPKIRHTLTFASDKKDNNNWVHGWDFLFATWGFSLSLHSLWSLPVAVLQHGGVAFVLMYLILLLVLGAPLLLLEVFLGQYSGLTAVCLYQHLCPLLAGLGVCQCLQSILRLVLDTAVLTWISQGVYLIFSSTEIDKHFFYQGVLNKADTSLDTLHRDHVLVLACVCAVVFLLVVAGHKALGKCCLILVPLCYVIILSLSVRCTVQSDGADGVLALISPNWRSLGSPTAWLEASCHVIFSLQLGKGVFSTYASHNKFTRNIIHDCMIVIIGHVLWVILTLTMVFSIIGIAFNSKNINITNQEEYWHFVDSIGSGLWLVGVTMVEVVLTQIPLGWVWSVLLFVMIIMVGVFSVFGHLHLIVQIMRSFNPAFAQCQSVCYFLVVSLIYLLNLGLATIDGLHIYHLLSAFIALWPPLLFCLLTLLAAIFSHGIPHLLTDIKDMTRASIPPWIHFHLSIIYYTVAPVLATVSISYYFHANL